MAIVIALVLLQLIVVGMVLAGSRDQAMGVHRAESLRTLYAADAGLEMALRELAQNADEDGDGTIGSISADNSTTTGPLLLGSRISTVLAPASPTAGEIVSGSVATQASRRLRAAYIVPPPGGGGSGGVGLAMDCFTLSSAPANLASVPWSGAPTASGPAEYINFVNASSGASRFWNNGPASRYGVRLSGKINIPQAGSWVFTLGSDDGSRLLIDGVQVINHDGAHSYSTRTGTASLTSGEHDIQVLFFENAGNHGLTLAWRGPGVPTTVIIPPDAMSLSAAPSPEFPPLAVSGTVAIWGDNSASAAFIDGFDGALGPYGGTNILSNRLLLATNATANQSIQMSNLAQIRGSAQVGPGGNPSTAIALWSGSQITGGSAARTRQLAVHRPLEPFVTMPATEGTRTYTSSMTINTNRRFQDLNVWGNSTVVTIVGDVSILCEGNFSIGDRVAFELAAGATLRLFIRGDANLYTDAAINMNTGDPSRCWVHLLGNSRRVQLTDRAKLVAHVRNPRGGLEMSGTSSPGSELFGTFHGTSLVMSDKARLHADVSLLEPGPSGGGGGGGGGVVTVPTWALEP